MEITERVLRILEKLPEIRRLEQEEAADLQSRRETAAREMADLEADGKVQVAALLKKIEAAKAVQAAAQKALSDAAVKRDQAERELHNFTARHQSEVGARRSFLAESAHPAIEDFLRELRDWSTLIPVRYSPRHGAQDPFALGSLFQLQIRSLVETYENGEPTRELQRLVAATIDAVRKLRFSPAPPAEIVTELETLRAAIGMAAARAGISLS